LSPEDRDLVRAYCDKEGIPRVTAQMDDQQVEAATEFVDGLRIAAAQDRDAEASQDAPAVPAADPAPDHAEMPPDAPTATQDAPETAEDRATRINMEVAAMSDKDVLAHLEARRFIDQTDFPDGITAEVNDQRRMLAMLLFTDQEPAAIVEGIEEQAQAARQARRGESHG
jgi:hypothetical protein